MSNYDKYLSTYSGRSLLEKHSLDDVGMWQVRGEDPNCDMGGSHHMPEMGVYEGRLRDIIEMAVEMPRFWQWGAGGSFELISVKKVTADTAKRQRQLRDELTKLEAREKEIKRELGVQ